MSACAACGARLPASARFCAQCGARVAPQPSEPPPTRAAPSSASAPRSSARTAPHVLYVAPVSAPSHLALAERCATDHTAHVLVADGPSAVQAQLATLDRDAVPVAAVCLLGTHDELPHAAFADVTGTGDQVLTDNDYGMLSAADAAARSSALALPDVPVCRIPNADPRQLERLLRVRDGLPATWDRGVAVSCAVWEGASAAVLQQIQRQGRTELQCVPPGVASDVAARMGPATGRLYFNVHGSDQVAYWVGEGPDGAPPALHARDVAVAENAILVSEACFGARHDALDGESIASAFLRNGGAAFVGSTIIAWGPVAPPIGSADLIVTGTYAALDAGLPLPAALLEAKRKLLQAVGEPLNPIERNTLASFVAYGGPMASVAVRRSASSIRSAGTIGDVLGRARASRAGRSTGPLAAARERLAMRAARMGYTPVAQQALTLAELAEQYPRASRLLDAVQATLGVGGALSKLQYTGRYGAETAVVAVPKGGGHPSIWILDRTGAVRTHRVARGANPQDAS